MKTSVLALCMLIGSIAPLEAQECGGGRIVTDEVDIYGGRNDINGDGTFDISDMVRGLGFLFLGEEPPCPLILVQAPTVIGLRQQVGEL